MDLLTGSNKIKAAVFISGTGSNLKSLIKFSKSKYSPISIDLIVSNNRKAKGLEDMPASQLLKKIREKAKLLDIDSKFLSRSLNEGFSGGEKKRNEIFQMAMLEPSLSILDETDSGLDIDALKIVANGVNKLKNKKNATIVITHYQRLLDYIVPDFVHVLFDGKIVKSGTKELAHELEAKGYDWIKELASHGI